MKYYKFYKSTYLKKIANTLTSEQVARVHTNDYPVDGPVFVPCEFVGDSLYKECEELEDKLNPYK